MPKITSEVPMKELFEIISFGVEALAVGVLSLGVVISTGRFLFSAARCSAVDAYHHYRRELGRTQMLALELLIAADIIFTIAIEPSYTSLSMLAILVVIRTFLSFALEVEVTGHWPWQGGDETDTTQ
jgi:uncharacterized membrane protein